MINYKHLGLRKPALVTLLTVAYICLPFFSLHAQNVAFSYDGAGNRILRKIVTLNMRMASMSLPLDSLAAQKDSVVPEKAELSELPLCTLSVTPNPTRGEITVSVFGADENVMGTLILRDNRGELLFTRESIGNTEVSFDLSASPAGMYHLNFYQGENRAYYKIIKID